MKVLNVNEVLSELDTSIKKKKEEKEQILDLRDSLNKISSSKDSLDGKMGDAIREHFTVLHIPAVLLINQFLDQYTKQLKKIKDSILNYEDKNGLIKQEFIDHDVEQGLKKIERMTEDLIEDINQDFNEVRDLVSASPLSTTSIHYSIESARIHNKSTIDELNEIDQQSVKELKKSLEDLKDVSSFIKKIKTWSSKGIVINENTIKEINNYFTKNDTLTDLIDSAVELSVEQGDSTVIGDVADWLDKMGKFKGGTEILKATGAAGVLLSKGLILRKDGKGNFIVSTHPDWKQKNGKYNSKLADTIHGILKKGSNSSIPFIKEYFSKFQNSPGRLLRTLVGLNPRTGTISLRKVLEDRFKILQFSDNKLRQYKSWPVDVKKTINQFKDSGSAKKLLSKIPYAGIAFSLTTNAGDYFSDDNKYKSKSARIGRVAAGIGLDVGVSGLTTGGAVIGTMICPGIGTIIGGAVGAAIGIGGSFLVEDKVKEIGEKAGEWAKDKMDDLSKIGDKVKDSFTDKLSDAKGLVTGLFK